MSKRSIDHNATLAELANARILELERRRREEANPNLRFEKWVREDAPPTSSFTGKVTNGDIIIRNVHREVMSAANKEVRDGIMKIKDLGIEDESFRDPCVDFLKKSLILVGIEFNCRASADVIGFRIKVPAEA